MKIFKADLYLEKIRDLSIDYLKKNNIKGLLIDIDNTIMDYDYNFTEDADEWVAELISNNIDVCFVSNTKSEKKKDLIEKKFGCIVITKAGKPLKKGFNKALEILKLKPNEVAIIGDQIFSDVLGGRIMGSKTIYINPIASNKEPIVVKIKRPVEKMFLKQNKNN